MTNSFTWREVRKSASTFPITALYAFGVLIILLIQQGIIGVTTGIVMLSLITMLALLFAITKELRAIHILVNFQHEALVARVNQLLDTMGKADVDVPDGNDDSKGIPKS